MFWCGAAKLCIYDRCRKKTGNGNRVTQVAHDIDLRRLFVLYAVDMADVQSKIDALSGIKISDLDREDTERLYSVVESLGMDMTFENEKNLEFLADLWQAEKAKKPEGKKMQRQIEAIIISATTKIEERGGENKKQKKTNISETRKLKEITYFAEKAQVKTESKINEAAISFLEMNLQKPLFNLSDPKTKSAYETLLITAQANVNRRDTSSWMEITNAVQEHLKKYGPGALIIIEGAATHIWGAVPQLEKEGCRYIGSPFPSIDAQTKFVGEKIGTEGITVQIRRAVGVVKYLGFGSIEDFIMDRRKLQNPSNVIVSLEESGLHGIRTDENEVQIYKTLKKYLLDHEPSSVLYIGEDLKADEMRKDTDKYRTTGDMYHSDMPRNKFLMVAIDQKIEVGFGAFGLLW